MCCVGCASDNAFFCSSCQKYIFIKMLSLTKAMKLNKACMIFDSFSDTDRQILLKPDMDTNTCTHTHTQCFDVIWFSVSSYFQVDYSHLLLPDVGGKFTVFLRDDISVVFLFFIYKEFFWLFSFATKLTKKKEKKREKKKKFIFANTPH